MREIMNLAHEFLQHFCCNNSTNQSLLNLFFQSGDSVSGEGGEGARLGEGCD